MNKASYYIGVHRFSSYEEFAEKYKDLGLTKEIADELLLMREEGFTEKPNSAVPKYMSVAFDEAFKNKQELMRAYNFEHITIGMFGVEKDTLEEVIVREARKRIKCRNILRSKRVLFRGKETNVYDAAKLLELDVVLIYDLVKRGYMPSVAFIDAQVDKQGVTKVLGDFKVRKKVESTGERYTVAAFTEECDKIATQRIRTRKEKEFYENKKRLANNRANGLTYNGTPIVNRTDTTEAIGCETEKELIEKTMLTTDDVKKILGLRKYKYDFAVKMGIIYYDYRIGNRKYMDKSRLIGKEKEVLERIELEYQNERGLLRGKK